MPKPHLGNNFIYSFNIGHLPVIGHNIKNNY